MVPDGAYEQAIVKQAWQVQLQIEDKDMQEALSQPKVEALKEITRDQ